MTDCVQTVRLGTVVSGVRAYGDPRVIPFPEGAWFSVRAICTIFEIDERWLRRLVKRHKAHLTYPPVYRVKGIRQRRYRLFSEADYHFFRTLFPVMVGPYPRSPKKPEPE